MYKLNVLDLSRLAGIEISNIVIWMCFYIHFIQNIFFYFLYFFIISVKFLQNVIIRKWLTLLQPFRFNCLQKDLMQTELFQLYIPITLKNKHLKEKKQTLSLRKFISIFIEHLQCPYMFRFNFSTKAVDALAVNPLALSHSLWKSHHMHTYTQAHQTNHKNFHCLSFKNT